MLYFSKIQDDSHRIIAPVSCIMPRVHQVPKDGVYLNYGLDCGLDWWTGLMDWTGGLDCRSTG